jgi:hypothetical protein
MAATASSIAANMIDAQPVFFIAHLVTEAITRAVIPKCIICCRRRDDSSTGKA